MPNPSAPRHNGKQQAPEVRKHNFEEVAEIFTKEEALAEAASARKKNIVRGTVY